MDWNKEKEVFLIFGELVYDRKRLVYLERQKWIPRVWSKFSRKVDELKKKTTKKYKTKDALLA